jgi:nucleoside-diphosphate-sugar epimerase
MLASAGHEVTCLMRPTSSGRRLDGVPAALAWGDVTDHESLVQAVRGKSIVYHVAGCLWTPRIADFYQVNEEGTRNLLKACSQMDRPPVVVIVSSLAAAGPSLPHRPRIETDPPAPVSHYGRSKRWAEVAARDFAHTVPVTVVRPPIVLGDGDRYGLAMFKSVARIGRHFVPSRTPQRYSVIHVHDLIEAIALAAERGSRLAPRSACGPEADSRGIYFVAGEESPTYAELGRMIGEALGRKRTRIVRIPMAMTWAIALVIEAGMRVFRKAQFLNLDKAREIAAGSWTCSAQKARRELGFRTAAPLSERLCQTAAWYRRFGWL